jgi:hypothetical protein
MILLWLLLACGDAPSPVLQAVRIHLDAGAPRPQPPAGRALPADVREALVARLREQPDPEVLALYVDLASREAPEALRGANVLREDADVALLLSLATDPVLGRRARTALYRRVPRALLRDGRAASLATLTARDDLTVRLLAKAGVGEPAGVDDPLLRAWAASTGDTAAEQALLDAAASAHDGEALAEAVDALGWAATDRTLRALGRLLRTPHVRPDPLGQRSVRLDVLEALAVHFPEEIVFATQEITAAKDYRRAEVRVEALLGVLPEGEVPPFFTRGSRPPEP